MSVHFHSNKCTNTPPAGGGPEISGAAPAAPAFVAPLPAEPALAPPAAVVPALPPLVFAVPLAPAITLPLAPVFAPSCVGGASEPVPQAAIAQPSATINPSFLFTEFPDTLLVVPGFVKPNHGKTPQFTG
jgi:hypothetical protein